MEKIYISEAFNLLNQLHKSSKKKLVESKKLIKESQEDIPEWLIAWRDKLGKEFDEIRRDPSLSWRKSSLLKQEKEYYKALREYQAEQRNTSLINKAKLSKLITKLSEGAFTPLKTSSTSIRGYRNINSGNFYIEDGGYMDDYMTLYFHTSNKEAIQNLIDKLISNGVDVSIPYPGATDYRVSKFLK